MIAALLLLVSLSQAQAQAQLPTEGLELKTLFTTPEERRLIDRNRYQQEPRVAKAEPRPAEPAPEPKPVVPMVTVEKAFVVSGISINPDGSDVAWINGVLYEDGARLEDGIRLRISARDGTIRLIVPGGRSYTARAGERVSVTLRQRAEQR